MNRNKAVTALIAITIIIFLTTFIIRHSGRKPESHPSTEAAPQPAVSQRSHPPGVEPSATPPEAEKSSGHANTQPIHASAELREAIAREAAEAGQQREAYDQPGEAAEFYRLKRVPEGEKYVPVERYLAAREQMRRMPRYSTAQNRLLSAEQNAAESSAEENLLGAWTPLGPGNIGGRTRALLIDPTDPNVMYAAGVTGGVWKTTNGGAMWTPLADLIANIAVSALVMDPKNPNVIYAGTGEGVTGDFRGAGIFRTINGGATWTQLGSTGTSDFYFVNDLIISPTNSQRIYAATSTGVWRSLDGGATWNQALNPQVTGGCLDLAIRTDQPTDYIFASCGTFQQATIYRNPDAAGAGAWTAVHTEAGMGRTSLALAPSNQNVIYAAAAEYLSGTYRHGLHAVFRSTSSGDAGTWTAQVRNTDAVRLNTLLFTNTLFASLSTCGLAADSFSSQGWYDNVMAVDPTDENRVWVGGIDLFRSDDGGRNWGLASHWWAEKNVPQYAHADQHVIAFHPAYNGFGNQTMFVAGDGGVFRTGNARAAVATGPFAACNPAGSAVTWTSLNNNYGVTQFYHGAVSPDGQSWIGGTQDNGVLLGTEVAGSDGWREIIGGDGGFTAVDPTRPNTIYAANIGFSLRKSVDGGATFGSARSGIKGAGLFITPFVMDPGDPQRLWTGGTALWRTTNGAANWRQASQTLDTGTTFVSNVSAIAVAPTHAGYVLAGTTTGSVHRTDRGLNSDERTVWPASFPRGGYVSWLAFDPANHHIAYATYSTFGEPHVWRSPDGGVSWAAIDGAGTGALPDIPVNCLVVDPNNSSRLYIATDLGVFTSNNGGQSWAVENSGFPNTVVELLTINTVNGVTSLYAFTHGRGVWRVTLGSNGCSYTLSPAGASFDASGGAGKVKVAAAPGGCVWVAENQADWLSITGRNGESAVDFQVAPNASLDRRVGVLTIAGRSFVVTQSGFLDNVPPTLTMTSPTTAETYRADSAFVTLAGTATDNVGIARVSWTNERGGGGEVSSSGSWTITSIPLRVGINRITVTAADTSGNESRKTLVVLFYASGLYTAAGGGSDLSGEGIPATTASIYGVDLAFDRNGNLYIATYARVRRITTDGLIRTVAGSGEVGNDGDGGPATSAKLHGITGIALDPAGNLYIADNASERVRKVSPDGIITTFAGGGNGPLGDGGPALGATVVPTGVAADGTGNVYISDVSSDRIRKVNPQGIISTVAGGGSGSTGPLGDSGPATDAILSDPADITLDDAGNLYIADPGSQRVRRVTLSTGIITTVAGGGSRFDPYDNVPATRAFLNQPVSVALDSAGNLYICDQWDRRIRKVTAGTGIISTLAGGGLRLPVEGMPPTEAAFQLLKGLAADQAGSIYFCEPDRFIIRRVSAAPADSTPPVITITAPADGAVITSSRRITLSGTATDNLASSHLTWINNLGGNGLVNGSGAWEIRDAELKNGLNHFTITAWDNAGNNASATIRVTYKPGVFINRIAGTGINEVGAESGSAVAVQLWQPETVAVDAAGNLYVADTGNHRIRRVSRDGVITTVAGNGQLGSSGDGGPATAASLNEPHGVALDAAGNLYIGDTNNHRIRKVTPAGTISTVAGTGLSGFGGDGGPATQARLDTPVGLATDAQGNLYIADAGNHRIRKLTGSAGLMTTVAGNGYGFGGDGGAAVSAQLNFPTGVAIDGAGNLYISDTGNHRLRRVNAAGTISTVAGNGSAGFSGDGGPATAAQLDAPGGIGLDSAGNLFITDQGNHRVRKLTTDGRISTVAGNGTSGAGGEGGAATEAQLNAPAGVAIDRAGNLFIADTFNHRVVVVADYKAATTVSAASYGSSELPGEAIAAAFGTNLATTTQPALTLPLPTALAGTTVRVRDSRGLERLAPLFFVSPQQVNYQLPAGTAAGPATITITNADGSISTGAVNIVATAPGLFSADASGSGLAAALVFRIKADGTQSYEPVAQFDPAQQKFIAVPIDLSNSSEQVFLILFGTGLRHRSALSAVTAQIGGVDTEVNYAGPQGGFVGLDQVNVRLPRSLIGQGQAAVRLTVDGKAANTVQIRIE